MSTGNTDSSPSMRFGSSGRVDSSPSIRFSSSGSPPRIPTRSFETGYAPSGPSKFVSTGNTDSSPSRFVSTGKAPSSPSRFCRIEKSIDKHVRAAHIAACLRRARAPCECMGAQSVKSRGRAHGPYPHRNLQGSPPDWCSHRSSRADRPDSAQARGSVQFVSVPVCLRCCVRAARPQA